jgi:indolepyruvate ferredoxin oxidoreductase alpha subunit
MHSSQNEQDTRNYARFAKIPILEPADSQEALDFVKLGIELSEQFKTPVILRTTTRVSHSRSIVKFSERQTNPRTIALEKNPARFVPVPLWAREMRKTVEKRIHDLQAAAVQSRANRIEWRDKSLGIITHSVVYQYVREVWPEASVLKLGFAYPYPDELFRQFAAGVKNLLIVEELDDFLEEHIKALGIACKGHDVIPNIGELSITTLEACRAKMEGRTIAAIPEPKYAKDLPARPPVLCRDVRIAASSMPSANTTSSSPATSAATAWAPSSRSIGWISSCAWAAAFRWLRVWTRPARNAKSSAWSAIRRSSIPASPACWTSPTIEAHPR